ncbi:MAG: aminotransferase class I/II-fold pyridoxal phosphate-dependent enzyme, partial [Anaerolineae bacterium]|nr:aminotransferase class I/II-fold pyridoxal phosphate-dependent enzyme [Anaerolineae bacterium]
MRRIAIAEFIASPEQRRLVQEVLDSGRISEGPKVSQFEQAWASFVGSRHCVATNSGTSALMVGLLALRHRLGLPRGTKAITSALSFIATSNAIRHAGFAPVYVDVDPVRFHLLPDQVEELLEGARPGEYGAIVPVHLMGYPAPMGRLLELGRPVGSLGALGIFSFYISHNIQGGEMGAVTTDDEALDDLIRRLKDQGRIYHTGEDLSRWFVHDLVGFNFKTTEFQAALALPQVEAAEAILQARRENVRGLNARLAHLQDWFQLPEY